MFARKLRELKDCYCELSNFTYKVNAIAEKVKPLVEGKKYNEPSQEHLKSTHGRRTNANIEEEPAMFPRFRFTSCHGGDILSFQIAKAKRVHTKGCFSKNELFEVVFI